jgi:hypothetical protein
VDTRQRSVQRAVVPETLVVLVEVEGDVVLVDPTPVVDVVLPPTDVVVLELGFVVDVVVDVDVVVEVVVEVVVVVGAGSVVVGLFSKILSTVVPPPPWPKRSASGRPAMSSTTVTKRSEKTNTPNAARATTGQRMPPERATAGSMESGSPGGTGGGAVEGSCWVTASPEALASPVASGLAAALVAVSSAGTEDSPDVDSVTPAVVVPPNRRSNEVSGALTTTCLTALFVFSMDWKTRAVPVVAAMEPIATPTIVPLTPKMDATMADSTAPTALAKICR